MEYFYIIFAGGMVLIALFIQYDREQRKRIKSVLQKNKHVQPLLMQRTVEQKLSRLLQILNSVSSIDVSSATGEQEYAGYKDLDVAKEQLVNKVEQLQRTYNNGQTPLETYITQLRKLDDEVAELKESFEQYLLIASMDLAKSA